MTEQLIVIRTLDQLKELSHYISDKDFLAFDIETCGVEKGSEIIGFSVCADTEVAYYVVLAEWVPFREQYDTPCTSCKDGIVDVEDDDGYAMGEYEQCSYCLGTKIIKAEHPSGEMRYLETREVAARWLFLLQGKKLVAHNAVFDCSMISDSFGVSLIESVHTDTMLLAHLLDENRPVGLKDLGVSIFGEDAAKEQAEMKASVAANGGVLTKANYELYKADSNLIGRYGAKDTILTLKLFYHLVPQLYEQGLNKFFYEEETMPLLRSATYELNTEGLKIDTDRLAKLRCELEADIMEAKAFIYKEITPLVKDKYPGTGKTNVFNIGSGQQLAWLLFERLGQPFHALTDEGKVVCKFLGLKLPYALAAKREFIRDCVASKGQTYEPPKGGKRPKTIGDWWKYVKADKETLAKYADKYQWVKKFQTYNKDLKLLNTYVTGIQERMKYGVVHSSFLQHGTTSGRYSSRNPNLQNIPRDDKRIKQCIVAREGEVLVGADQSQLEVRVFAAMSQDAPLLASFKTGEDFYSVIGMTVFGKTDCTPYKEGSPDAFGVKYKRLRDIAKVVALSATYGTTAPKMAVAIGKPIEEAQEIIDDYFSSFPGVKKFQLDSHAHAKEHGHVKSYFGRIRRIPEAKKIPKRATHESLPYEQRNLLNLAVNHPIQGTAANTMNRCSIRFCQLVKERGLKNVKLICQVHDSLVARCPKELGDEVAAIMEEAMTNTVSLPGVDFEAKPKIGHSMADVS